MLKKQLRFLNGVLTLIAVSLVVIILQNAGFITTVQAKRNTVKTPAVAAKTPAGPIDVNITSVGGYSVWGGKLKVEVSK